MNLMERLRYWESDGHPHGLLHGEAADEITRLRDALRPFAECELDFSWQPGDGGSRIHLHNLIPPAKREFDAARAALKEQQP